jgi:hypothetical protein
MNTKSERSKTAGVAPHRPTPFRQQGITHVLQTARAAGLEVFKRRKVSNDAIAAASRLFSPYSRHGGDALRLFLAHELRPRRPM